MPYSAATVTTRQHPHTDSEQVGARMEADHVRPRPTGTSPLGWSRRRSLLRCQSRYEDSAVGSITRWGCSDPSADAALSELRETHSSHVVDDGTAISRSSKGDVHWWTWAGSATNRTLHASLSSLVDRRQRVSDHAVRLFFDLSFSEIKEALTDPLTEKLPEVNDSAVEGLKFASALPDSLARATVAERLADFPGMREVIGEPRTFIQDEAG